MKSKYGNIKPYIVLNNNNPNDKINLVINQNYNKHHPNIKDTKINYYPNRGGKYLSLIKEISRYIGCLKDEILLTNGCDNALKLIMDTYCYNTSKVLIPFPNYPGFIHRAKLCKANITFIDFFGENHEYKTLYENIKNNDIIYISSPNLPIGYEIDTAIYYYIEKYNNKLFIIDEAYFEYGTKTKSHFYRKFDNLIIVRTFSKAFALAGARVGYIVANKNRINELKVAHCDKDITDHSINLCYNVMIHRNYYLHQVRCDKRSWQLFFNNLQKYICKDDIIYEYIVNKGPYFLIFTKYPVYVLDLFKKNGYLVRNKTDDLGRGCLRITLSKKNIMDDVLNIIKKINGYYNKYEVFYLDIDNTIRDSKFDSPPEELINKINYLSKHKEVNFITNNIENSYDIENYLNNNNIDYKTLICPFKNFDISSSEYNNGYFIRGNKLYITKFPNITYELINFIYEHKLINIIEEDYEENSCELGFTGRNIRLPFIGSFQELLKRHNVDVDYNIIGKKNILINKNTNKETIVIGDSNDDFLFAIKNGFYFKHVSCKNDTNYLLNRLI